MPDERQVAMLLGRVSMVPRGEYDPAETYQRLDMVRWNGSGYVALRVLRGVEPEDGADWMLLAERGGQGIPGEPGPQGPAGPWGPAGGAVIELTTQQFAFSVSEEGRLLLHYNGEEAPAFRINPEDGHLYFDIT